MSYRRLVRSVFAPLAVMMGLLTAGPGCAPAVQVNGVIGAGSSAAAEAGTALPLWELNHAGRTLYLLGSVHLLRQDVYPLDEAIYSAFDEAEVVAFELDFDEMMASAPMMMQRGMFNDGRTLRDVIPGELYIDVIARGEHHGIPAAVVDAMKPWMAAMTLSSVVLQQGGFEASAGLDLHLHERAKNRGMEIVGLETMEEQLDVFDGLDQHVQVAFLRSTVEQMDGAVAQMDIATNLWRRGDTDRLGEMFLDQMGNQPQAMERLLYQRNRNWISGIEALLASGRTAIVVVGVGHLAGEGSVIDLLRERGYAVTQLRTQLVGAESR